MNEEIRQLTTQAAEALAEYLAEEYPEDVRKVIEGGGYGIKYYSNWRGFLEGAIFGATGKLLDRAGELNGPRKVFLSRSQARLDELLDEDDE